jgi:hypothetical protein
MISKVAVFSFSGNTRFNDPSRILFEAWTKPSRYMPFKSWNASGEGCTHAHEITDAEAREVSSCFLRISKRFEKVWPSSRLTKTRNDHVFASLPLSRELGASTSEEADSASLAVSIEQFLSKK